MPTSTIRNTVQSTVQDGKTGNAQTRGLRRSAVQCSSHRTRGIWERQGQPHWTARIPFLRLIEGTQQRGVCHVLHLCEKHALI